MIYPWQHKQWSHVTAQHQQQRMPQALLLTGNEGLGQFDFAKNLAQFLLCDAPNEQPCQQCRQCHLFNSACHPDYYCIEPVTSSRVIKVDQIRDLIDQVTKTAHAHSQVIIINTLELMNIHAFNALLKTLEEPAGAVFFLLVCHQLGSVPMTIISRCQKLHFFLDNKSAALHWLDAQSATQHNEIVLRIANYAPLLAQQLAQKNILTLRDKLLKKLVYMMQGDNPLSQVDALLKQDIYDIVMLLHLLLLDIRRCQLGVDADKLTHADCAADLQKLAAYYQTKTLQAQLDAISKTDQALRRGVSVNPQLALEGVFVKT